MPMLRSGARTARLERIAPLAVADIKVILDDRKHHRVGAVQERAIFHRLIVHVGGDVRRALAVPAKLVSNFGSRRSGPVTAGRYTISWIVGKDKRALELTL
jgi:hypothetical protein